MSEALLYTRVSSDDQVRGVSLDDQANAGREWIERNLPELRLVSFREEGESARTLRRTKLTAALRYIEQHPGRVVVFVVYDLSRFARNLFEQLQVERLLSEHGVRLVSITQPLPEGPEGEFFSGQIGLMNQYSNRKQGEKIRRCMLETVRQGRWPHLAPIGYRNGRDGDGRKIVEMHPDLSEPMRVAFRRVAAGDGLREALRELNERVALVGVRPVAPKRFRDLLVNPFYVGRVRSGRHGVEEIGRHEALVDDATWHRVQRRFAAGRQETTTARVAERPEFPLRGFVRCEACGRPLTASSSRGKTGVRYPYYRCWWPNCGRVKVRAERLEAEVIAGLEALCVVPAVLAAFAAALERIWSRHSAEAQRTSRAASRRLAELEARRERLVESYALEGGIDRATFERLRTGLDGQISSAHLELSASATPAGDLADLLAFAKPFLTGLADLWRSSDATRKRRLQRLAWPAGITYGERGLGTQRTACVFNALRGGETMKNGLVEQTAETWNSIVLELLAFGEVMAA